ncbi:HlyD family secretion protein [Paracoccus sphaerophysae]|uniref:HlyD family secretion protein n=1 Tax=Paracoccus sphaerophysae TaxID=690417 RepID=UPI002355A1A9|nr:efflux RND transporter periplasmic adaptor subunit [Paracoccus sphaerophysae]
MVAPHLGVVTNLTLSPGQFASAGTPALTFIDAEAAWITADLRENQLGNVDPGDPAIMLFEARPGELFEGRVQSVAWGIDPGRSRQGRPGGEPARQPLVRTGRPHPRPHRADRRDGAMAPRRPGRRQGDGDGAGRAGRPGRLAGAGDHASAQRRELSALSARCPAAPRPGRGPAIRHPAGADGCPIWPSPFSTRRCRRSSRPCPSG